MNVNETQVAGPEAGAAFQTYAEAVDWITRRAPVFGMKPGLNRMAELMDRLGHPERRLKFIHVGGTNGKGSVCAYLTRVLIGAGYGVGTFTSPYIGKFTNRLRYNDKEIPEAELLRLANEVKPLADELAESELGAPTMFELCTAIAILYFARETYPDFVVWEVGLGGRLDSTNIVTPIVSVITNVGHDHMDILGDSLESVASEKAGIVKAGVPVISAVDQPGVVETVERACDAKNTTLYLMNRQFRYEPLSVRLDRQEFRFDGPFRTIGPIALTMNGRHQMANAAVALMTLEVLRQYYALIVEDDVLADAFRETAWPGRLEMIPGHPPILLDGAHNPEGAESLAAALSQLYTFRKLHIMIGMVSTKNHSGYLRHILPLADTLIVTEPDFFKRMEATRLADLAKRQLEETGRQVEVIVEPDWKVGLELLASLASPGDLAVVSGTLYLISDVRSWLLDKSDSEKGW